MAIDSKEKRASCVGINYLSGPSPISNVAKDQEWRQEVGYGYSGILAGGGAPPPGRIFRQPDLSGLGGQGQMTWNPLE